MKILLADAVATECADTLQSAGLTVDDRPGLNDADKLAAVADATGMVVRSATTVTAEMMDAAPELKVIGRAGSGVDNIDVAAATERGILVMNTPGENTLSAAEHAMAMLMAMCRKIPAADARLRGEGWSKKGLMGVELIGKTIGVIGMGRIGQAVAKRCRGFGMKILAYDPFLPPEVAENLGVEMAELDEIYPRVDFITLHTPLTDRTRHLLNTETLAQCKKNVRLINCARGGLIDEQALLEALESGHVAGAALDVFEQEPLGADSPLLQHPNLIVTPHLGASTAEAQEKVALRVAEQIAAYLNDGAVRNAVNSFSVDGDTAARLAPWQNLAESIGKLHAELLQNPCNGIEVEVAGDLLDLPSQPITNSVLHGFLAEVLSQNVNAVNAASIAQEHGIKVSETKGTSTDGFTGLLSVRIYSKDEHYTLAGSLFGHERPMLVRVDGFVLESLLKSHMLFCCNEDLPGRLAAISAIISNHGINIANCALGRDANKKLAVDTFQLDEPLPTAALKELRALDGVRWAHVLTLD
jgi:D-3-phosphoglycerate dehydrogenase / 2-oxoglutarate reductase